MASSTVTIVTTGHQFHCREDRSVLVAMEYLGGTGIQVGCRSGGCGVCRVQVISGSYTAKKMSRAHVTDDDLEHGIVLSCRIFATSDLEVVPCPKGSDVSVPLT